MSENSFIKTKENSELSCSDMHKPEGARKNIKGYLIPPSSFEVTKIFVFNNHHIIKSIQQNTVSAKKDFTLQLKKYGPSSQTSSSSLSFYKSPSTWKSTIPLCFDFLPPFTRLLLVFFIHHQRNKNKNKKQCFFSHKKKKWETHKVTLKTDIL